MNEYEITYLANPSLDEEAKNKLDEAIDAEIINRKGSISYSLPTDSPGSRRRLHYPIADKKVTWMRAIQTQLEQDTVEELRQFIRKTEGVTRVTIIQTPRREEVPATIFDQAEQEAAKDQKPKPAEPAKPAKEVTMKEVEEKIESALDEEVK